jgi:MFS family permease
MLNNVIQRTRNTYDDYPSQFWLVMGASFIDRLGGALMFPFFALYLTAHFDVRLTEVGFVFMLATVAGIVGSIIGGMLADMFGRKQMIIIGLITSALTSLSLIVVEDFDLVYIIGIFVGLFSSMGGPAQQAIIADLLPEEQHAEGYGMWRVLANLAVTIGPLVGGFMAGYSYALLFIIDAITSVITALIISFKLEETLPVTTPAPSPTEAIPGEPEPAPEPKRPVGYGPVLHDWPYLAFIAISMLMVLVYMQMNQTLPVYLRDVHGIPPRGYGYILSMNAGMVVLFQFWITRRISSRPPFLVMAAGTVLYGIGFGMYGVVSGMAMFMLAMVIITIGEMLTAPVAQALVAKFSPEDMRGRYMAIFGFAWAIPSAFGLVLAGLIADNIGPDWIWYLSSIVTVPTVIGFLMLHRQKEDDITDLEDALLPGMEGQSAVPAA